jgi:hypothetical protein
MGRAGARISTNGAERRRRKSRSESVSFRVPCWGEASGTDQEKGIGCKRIEKDGEVEHPAEAEEWCQDGDDDAINRKAGKVNYLGRGKHNYL